MVLRICAEMRARGWSTPVLLGEVLAAYRAYAAGGEPDLPSPRPYREYIAWLQRQDRDRAEDYWRRRAGL